MTEMLQTERKNNGNQCLRRAHISRADLDLTLTN